MKNEGLKSTFNKVVELYDTYRPSYVDELYKDILDYKPLDNTCKTVEVGIGTGKATKHFLDTETKLIGIELGDELATFVSKKYSDYSNFQVTNASFEDFECKDNSIDLIYAATAFHWIDEEKGYSKVNKLLKNGGAFARFANRPYTRRDNLSYDAIQEIFAKYMPASKARDEFNEEMCIELANIPLKYGFKDIEYRLYKRVRILTSDEYASLIGTYSGIIAMTEKNRYSFLSEIKAAIDEHSGGFIKIFDTIDLQLARK